jgi:branched-chain amino acid transport system ATP-binding protein
LGKKRNGKMFFSAEDLHVHYSRVQALKGISLSLEEGIIVSLIGANGSGKTTVLKAISGLVKLTTGEIRFQGRRIDGMSPYKIARLGIGHVLEGKRLFPSMLVADNLEMGAYLTSSKADVAKAFERIYRYFPVLESKHKNRAANLSGGEQQMLVTARALMANPRLLLMDDPSLGLSPLLVKTVAKIIKDINQDKVSVFLVEQNARMALRLSHRAYVMETGSIVLEGDAKKLANDDQVRKAYLGG